MHREISATVHWCDHLPRSRTDRCWHSRCIHHELLKLMASLLMPVVEYYCRTLWTFCPTLPLSSKNCSYTSLHHLDRGHRSKHPLVVYPREFQCNNPPPCCTFINSPAIHCINPICKHSTCEIWFSLLACMFSYK